MSPVIVVIPSMLVAGVLLLALEATDAPRPRQQRPRGSRARDWMARAGVGSASPGELLAFCLGVAAVVGLAVLAVTHALWLALAFAVLAGYLPVAALKARHGRRVRERREVWPDAIDHLVSAVRAGMSLPDAVSVLAERGPEALREPFLHFTAAYHATGRLGDALDRLKEELADPAADRVVEALRVARDVGGSELGRTLRTLSAFLRDEHRVRRELEARQSWVIVAARLAFGTPWLVLLLLATKPEAVAAYRRPGGAVVISAGAALATAGYRVMLRIGRLPVEERVLR
ncbi:MAG TPA: type II secretion system F family protein [Actinomycetes bacterium]|jgi:tight adherence protein B|nr:type II secretion system F family protein [Actinomycetes bacterium]